MTLDKYFKQVALIPSGIIILGYIIFIVYDLTIGPGKDYKSEWLTADSTDIYIVGIIIAHCMFVCLLCSTIFLNNYPKVRASFTLSLLSWFLLPMIYLGHLLFLLYRPISHRVDVLPSCLFL